MTAIETEVLVIGGGIAGASAAWHLAMHGYTVALVERGEIASGASGVNAGAIDSVGWGRDPDLQAHLTAGSLALFQQVQLDLGEDIEFRQSGALRVIHTLEQHDFTRDQVAGLRARGHAVELLTAREARSVEPGLCRRSSAPCTRPSAPRPIPSRPRGRSRPWPDATGLPCSLTGAPHVLDGGADRPRRGPAVRPDVPGRRGPE